MPTTERNGEKVPTANAHDRKAPTRREPSKTRKTEKKRASSPDSASTAHQRDCANAFSDAQVRAFGEACAQSRWCAVNKLSGDEVRTRPSLGPRSVFGFFSAVSFVSAFLVFRFFGCGHFFLATRGRAETPATRFDSRTAS